MQTLLWLISYSKVGYLCEREIGLVRICFSVEELWSRVKFLDDGDEPSVE